MRVRNSVRQVEVDLFAESVVEGGTVGAEVAQVRQLVEVLLVLV